MPPWFSLYIGTIDKAKKFHNLLWSFFWLFCIWWYIAPDVRISVEAFFFGLFFPHDHMNNILCLLTLGCPRWNQGLKHYTAGAEQRNVGFQPWFGPWNTFRHLAVLGNRDDKCINKAKIFLFRSRFALEILWPAKKSSFFFNLNPVNLFFRWRYHSIKQTCCCCGYLQLNIPLTERWIFVCSVDLDPTTGSSVQ